MTLLIKGPAGELEASYHNPGYHNPPQVQNAALLCHPHPSYGGNMHDGVLAVTASALENAAPEDSWAHLRFNFRGVGNSSGTFNDGAGEQEDLIAAWDWLREQQNWQSLTLIGYSFGAAMAWSAHERCEGLTRLVLIAPPTAAMPFSPVSSQAESDMVATHIIVGDRDDYCNLDALPANASSQVLPGADHFFSASTERLSTAVSKVLSL